MENELLIAQWLMDNSAILLLEYASLDKEMSEYLYLKTMAHQQFAQTLGPEEFEVAFDSEKVQLLIDFWFNRNSEEENIH